MSGAWILAFGLWILLTNDFTLTNVAIPLMNMLIACKVAIGSWTIILLFVRHRGLL